MSNLVRAGRWSLLVVGAAVLACSMLTVQWRLVGKDGTAWKQVIRGDAKGYYSYLPALFIHGDLKHPAGGEAHVNHTPHGDVRKYTLGTALAQVPFFMVADMIVPIMGGPRTGYEQPYHVAIAIGGVLALLIGLLALWRMLFAYGFSDVVSAAVITVLCAGTALVYAASVSPSFSHVWSFMAVACFLRSAQRGIVEANGRSVMAAGAWLGLIVLLRPVNGIVVLALPMLLKGWPFAGTWKGVWPRPQNMIAAVTICCALLFLQPLAWKLQTGQWLVWSYADEGFHWSRPEVFQVLFGPMKGLFFWWPLLLVIVPGFLLLLRKRLRPGLSGSRVAGGFGLGYFALLIYITSAWWSWYYGDGYGLRPILDHLPVLAIPIAVAVEAIKGRWRWVAGAAAIALCAMQCFQVWQFHTGIIHPHSMDWAKYRAVFLRTDDRWIGALGGNYEMAQYAPNGHETIFSDSLQLAALSSPWEGGKISAATTGMAVCIVGKQHPYSTTLHLDSTAIPDGRRLFVEAVITRTERSPGSSSDAAMVCEIGSNGTHRYYYKFRLNDLPSPPAGATETWHYAFPMGAALPQDGLKLYIWQPGEGDFTIDRFGATIRAVR